MLMNLIGKQQISHFIKNEVNKQERVAKPSCQSHSNRDEINKYNLLKVQSESNIYPTASEIIGQSILLIGQCFYPIYRSLVFDLQ